MKKWNLVLKRSAAIGLAFVVVATSGIQPVQAGTAEIIRDNEEVSNWVKNYQRVSPSYIFAGNMVSNPGFEDANGALEGWSVKGGGSASNNKHSGVKHFYLDAGSGNYMKQTVQIPYTGNYKFSVWLSTGAAGGVFGATKVKDSQVISKVDIPAKSSYTEYSFEAFLEKDEIFEIYVNGANGWINGDDFSVEYNTSKFVNLLVNGDFDRTDGWNMDNVSISDGKATMTGADSVLSQSAYIPVKGPYYAEIAYEGAAGAEASFNSSKITMDGTGTQRMELSDCNVGEEVILTVSGAAVVLSSAIQFDLDKIPNEAPAADQVEITGTCDIDRMLESQYAFTDPDGDTEGTSIYSWSISDTKDGVYQVIEGETTKNLQLTKAYQDKFIKFSVTPADKYGKQGILKESAPVGPVDLNVVNNPGFERNGESWNGFSIRNSDAYEGLVRGIVAAANTGKQTITIPKTGYYDFAAYTRQKTAAQKGTAGVRTSSGEVLKETEVPVDAGFQKISINHIALEEGQKAEVFFTAGDAGFDVDNVSLKIDRQSGIPAFLNLRSLDFTQFSLSSGINSEKKEVNFEFMYGTDLSNMEISEISVSDGATASAAIGDKVDLTKPFVITVRAGTGETQDWTVKATLAEKQISLKSSNTYLQDTFNWAANKQRQFVMTGKEGLVNKDENNPNGSGTAKYFPSYWAGYYDRTAYYSRDFVHQASGGQIAGLAEENYNMFHTFAENATLSKKWYTPWAFNFDGTPHTIDYKDDNNFVREVPAQFELVEKAYHQYLWSGDRRYVDDPDMFNFYTKVMTDYISLHDDQNPNGIPEGKGGIFQGSCTYNERGEHPIEAGDAIGSQYQATLAYAGILSARGEEEASKEWYKKAQDLKDYFNNDWSANPSDPNGNYARILTKDKTKKYDFGKENSWFIPLKMITEPGERNDNYIDYIMENLGEGIGTTPEAPGNLEAYTYIPDMLFLYNRNDEAWKWMKYITSIKDLPHERPSQGTNGDYPEISFTFVSHTIEGMMGVVPDAGRNFVATSPRLPEEVNDVTAKDVCLGDYELTLTHEGNQSSELKNQSGKEITWEAGFYGDYEYINIGGKTVKAEKKEINGEKVSYAVTRVAGNQSSKAFVTTTAPDPDPAPGPNPTPTPPTTEIPGDSETDPDNGNETLKISEPVVKFASSTKNPVVAVLDAEQEVKDGSVVIEVPDKSMEAAIKAAKEEAKKQNRTDLKIEVNVKTESSVNEIGVIISKDSLKKLAEDNVAFAVTNEEIVISADKAAINEINKQTADKFKFQTKKVTKLSKSAEKIIGTRPVYDVEISYGTGFTKEVNQLKKGKVTVSVLYKLRRGEKPGNVYAAYVNSNGVPSMVESSKYDKTSGMLSFSTSHLSVFGAAYKASVPSLIKQVKVTAPVKELKLSSAKGKETVLKVACPITMKKVSKYSKASANALVTEVTASYVSSNSKVAAVSTSGKITAKAPGKVTISTTLKAKDGTKTVVKTTINVKK